MTNVKDKMIDMILADSSTLNMLTTEAKTELFLYYIDKTEEKNIRHGLKTQQSAELYLLAKKFGIHRAQRVISDYLGISINTLDGRLRVARHKGFVSTYKRGTKHGTK